jgi:ABC-type antimicrobial peptide transport system permease subunit
VATRIRSWTLGAAMFGIFGALALVLATIGLYSVLAYDVAQRRHELGVRRALGAAASDIARLVVGRGIGVVVAGTVVGMVAALATQRAVEPLLFQTSARDPLVFASVAIVLAVVSLAATLLPAIRAASVDPSGALRGN